jgi:WD40 repeat protein
VNLWDLASDRKVGPPIAGSQDGSMITCVAFSPDGRRLATAGRDLLVRLWDVQSGELIRTLKGHMAAVFDVAFAPDGRRLVSSGSDCVRLWEVELGRELIAFEPHDVGGKAVEFSPDGKSLVSAGGNALIRVRAYKNSP